jgi:hypothetical protein
LKLNGLHGVILQEIALFINTAVRTSNPSFLNAVIEGPEDHNVNNDRREKPINYINKHN